MTASLWSVAARVPGSDIFNPLPASLVKQTYERPDHLAFVWTAVRRKELVVSEEFSYGVALRRVRAVARQLSTGLKLSKGNRVALCFPPGPEFVIAFLGCLYSGVVAVPVYPPEPTKAVLDVPRMCNILEKADVGAVLTTAWYKGIRRFIRSHDVRWDRLEWMAVSSEEDEGDLPPCHVSPEDLAFLQFTSGSTSMPKGVAITHGSLLQNSHLCLSVFGLECTTPSGHVTLDDAPLETMLHRLQLMQTEWEASKGHRGRGFSWLPFYHDMGLVGFVVTPLIFGGTAYMMSPVDFIKFPESWLQGLSMFKAQLTAGPNFAFELVCRKIRPEKLATLDLSEVSGILCGAEPIIPKVMQEFLKVFTPCGLHSNAIRPAFGLAENTLIVTGSPRRHFPIMSLVMNPESLDTGDVDVLFEWPLTIKQPVLPEGMVLTSCGVVLQTNRLAIVKDECSLPSDRVGEIWIRGWSLAKGYFNCGDEGFNRHLGHEGGWFATGDLGFLHHDHLFVCGRLKDMIIVNGRNFAAYDVERKIQADVSSIRPGCLAVFPLSGLCGVGFAGELKDEYVSWVEHYLHSEKNDEAMKRIARDVAVSVRAGFGVDLQKVWLLWPRTIPKTSSGKIRRAVAARMLETGDSAIKPRQVVDLADEDVGHQAEVAEVAEFPLADAVSYSLLSPTSAERMWLGRPSEEGVALRVTALEDAAVDVLVRCLSRVSKADVSLPEDDAPLYTSLALSSIEAVQLVAELENELDVAIPQTFLFEHPTMGEVRRQLALMLARQALLRGEGGEDVLVALKDAAVVKVPKLLVDQGACRFAIVAADLRLPGKVKSLSDMHRIFTHRLDPITECPMGWDSTHYDPSGDFYTREGGFVDIEFNPNLVPPAEASTLDPQQKRLLLSCHRLMAGLPDTGPRVGVFVASSSNEWSAMMPRTESAFMATATSPSLMSNRVSFSLGLTGPSITIDTACSSSLVAMDVALRSLRASQCDVAIVAAANSLMDCQVSRVLCKAGMLAPHGRCRTFDSFAEGYVRCEACVSLAVVPLSSPIVRTSQVLAIVESSHVNHGGTAAGLTVPNSQQQATCIRSAATAVPEVDYLETHGTGTSLGDPLEVAGISQAFEGREVPLVLGAAKSYFGHAEGAAGLVGVCAAIVALNTGYVPSPLHYELLNPQVRLPTWVQLGTEGARLRSAGVSSFGFGGTNAHVVLSVPDSPADLSEPQSAVVSLPEKRTSGHPLLGPLTPVLGRAYYLRLDVTQLLSHLCLHDQAVVGWGFLLDILFSFMLPTERLANVRFADPAPIPASLSFASDVYVPYNVPCPALTFEQLRQRRRDTMGVVTSEETVQGARTLQVMGFTAGNPSRRPLCVGAVRHAPVSVSSAPPLEMDPLNSLAPEVIYAKLATRGIHLKAAYRRIASCFLTADVIICELRTLELFEGDDNFALNPVTIDLALVCCLMLVNGAASAITSVRLETAQQLSTFRCERLSDMKCRVDIYDVDGRSVVTLGEVTFRPLTPPKAPMYRLSFKPAQVSSFEVPRDFLLAKLCSTGLVGSDGCPLTLGDEDEAVVVISPDADLSALDGVLASKMVVVSESPLLWNPPRSVGVVVCPLGSSIPSPDLIAGHVWRLQDGSWEIQTREAILGHRLQFQSLPPNYVRVAPLSGGGAVVTESTSDVTVGVVVDTPPLTSVPQAFPAGKCLPLDDLSLHSSDTLLIAGLPPDVSDATLEFAVMKGYRHVRLLDAEVHGRFSRSLSSAFDIQQANSVEGDFTLCYCSLSFYLEWLPTPSVVLHPLGAALRCPLPHPVSLLQYPPGVHRHDLLNSLSLLKSGFHTMSPLLPLTASVTHSHKLSASRPLREQISAIVLSAAVMVSGREDLEPNEVFGDAVDSLAAMEFRERISDSIGVEVPMSALFDHSTLEQLTSYLETIVCPAPQTSPVPSRASLDDPPCIAAFSLRLPGGVFDAESFWNMLTSPSDCRSLIPLSRFNVDSIFNADRTASGSSYVRHASFAPYMDRFCPEHFGINPLELHAMDPQHRIALTLALSCLASNRRSSASGFPEIDELYCNDDVLGLRETFTDQDIGVFIGSCNPDWHYMPNHNDTHLSSAYSCVGGSQALISNRISHTFNLRGPSQTVDAACASSLVALADACDSIAAGRCTGALVGGVNLLLAPQVFVGFSRTQVLSPDGACKSFSADADGYGRGEGASMMLILPLSRASALGYRPLGLVSGWAVSHSGLSASMTAPSAKGQERAMRGALSMAGIDPADVGVIETHGTGTLLGDAIEAEAIAAVYGNRDSPITLASLKSRVGHGEGNAGAAGVLKAVMMLDQESIPPNANFSTWNPNLPKGVEWRVPLETTPLLSEHIGVSAFGFGGVNAHVIISKAPTAVDLGVSCPISTYQQAVDAASSQVLLIFAGQGSQHPGILHDAYDCCGPRLARLIDHAKTIIGKDAMEAIWSESTDAKDPLLQMGLLLVQLAQAETIIAEEIPVAAVVGHSLGELTLAAFVGAINADEAIRLLWSRIRLLHSTAEGRMVVLRRTPSEVRSAIGAAGVGVSIGAINSATSVVLSGSSQEVDLVLKALRKDSPLLYKDLSVSHAFHSDLMEPVKEQFATACREILEERSVTSDILTISTVTGSLVDPAVFRTAAHWTNQLTSTVLFKDAVDTAAGLLTGRAILPVELGLRPILTSLLRELLPFTKPLAFSGQKALDRLTLAIAPPVEGVHNLLDPTNQPRQPWMPQDHPMFQPGLPPVYLRDDQLAVLMDHRIQSEALLPASQWVDLAMSLSRHLGFSCVQRVVVLRPTRLHLPTPGVEPPIQLRFQLREDLLEVSCLETDSRSEHVVMSSHMSSSHVDSSAESLEDIRLRLEPVELQMESLYTELAEAGLQYGPHFRCLRSVSANQERTEFLSLVEAPSCAVTWTETDWLTGVTADPRLLDASLHPVALMNLLSKTDLQDGQALIPAEFRGVAIFAPLPTRVLSHLTLLEVVRPKPLQTVEPPRSVSVKLDLRSEEGQLLLRIERISLHRVDMKPTIAPITRILWSEDLQSFSPTVECVEGVYCVGVHPTCGFRPFQSPEELRAATCLLFRVENMSDVLKLVGLLKAIRDLNLSSPLVIWVVEEFGGGIGRGFVRGARLELQRLLPHVILKHYEGRDQGLHLVLASPEADVVFRDGIYFGRRLHQIPTEILHPKRLVLGNRGSINSLEPRSQAQAARREPEGTAVEVRVMAVGLNFRDVLNVLGLYPGQPGPPGADFAGVITRTGDAAGVEVGERVYGLAPGCLQPFAITDSRCIRPIPPSLDFQNASCVPIAAVTVEYAFADLAKVQMGDTVLVHAVTGAVGLMALQYCRRVGAVCIGTAGNEYKRSKALELGVAFASSSRDADTFIEETRRWLESDNRDGVDVVLNSLIGDFIPFSLSLVKSDGCFVELGKRENWSTDAVARQFPNVKYQVVAVDTLSVDDPEWMGGMLDRVSEQVGKRHIVPLPMHVTSVYSDSHGLESFRHLQRAQHIGKVVLTFDSPFSGGTLLISGGFGALGGVLVRWAADEGVRHFILVGRSSRCPSFEHLRVHCVQADVADFEQLERALNVRPADFPPITSIFHLAGVLDDRPLFDITSESMEVCMRPKALGFRNLDQLSRAWPVKNFVVFSSVTAVLGNASQVNYGISNAVMEELAAGRREDGLSCAVIQWGPWTDQGMASAFAPLMEATGLLGIDNETALRCLLHVLQYRSSQTTLVQPIRWTNFCSSRRYDQIHMPPFFSNEMAAGLEADQTQVHVAVDDSLLQMTPEDRAAFVADLVRNTAAKIIGCRTESLSMSVPVVESGIDSLGAVEFGSILSKVLGVSMGPTILFDYPTLGDITTYLQEELECLATSASKATTPTKTRESSGTSTSSDHDTTNRYAIVGMSCRMPKDVTDPDSFWKALLQGKDSVGPVPDARFDLEAIYNADPAAPNCTYATEAGFMRDIDLFDRGFFRLSEEEVSLMDPQQRILLEMLVDCGTDAGLITNADTLGSANTLKGSNWGVFVGMCNADWLYTSAVDQCNSTFSSTGVAHCMASNRISYLLGLKGPSMTIDTACSSSLVALDVALSSMNADPSIEGCFVGGVNLMLTPHPFVSFAKTRMLSPDSRCKTFDASANGYARGEGGGFVALVSEATAQRLGLSYSVVVCGSAVNHDGVSASLTAPNGLAQQETIRKAWSSAGLSPTEALAIECHGTGTALGDPIEALAIKAVCRPNGYQKRLSLMTVKTHIGHLEGGAGIAGVIKAVLCLEKRFLVPNLHFSKLNPHIDFDGAPIEVCTSQVTASTGSTVGVSSFGFGGANAHAVLQSVPGCKTHHVVRDWRRTRFPWADFVTGVSSGLQLTEHHPPSEVRRVLLEHLLNLAQENEASDVVAAVLTLLESDGSFDALSEFRARDTLHLWLDSLALVTLRDQIVTALDAHGRLAMATFFDHEDLGTLLTAVFDDVTTLRRPTNYIAGIPKDPEAGDLVVVGVGVRLPHGVSSLSAFWDFVSREPSKPQVIPATRFETSRLHSTVPGMKGFLVSDQAHLLTEHQLNSLGLSSDADPHQFLAVEVCKSALLMAGVQDESTSMHLGCADTSEWSAVQLLGGGSLGAPKLSSSSLIPSAVGLALGTTGVCTLVDTGCASFATALEGAMDSVSTGKARYALAVGISLLLTPLTLMAFSERGLLSPSGVCRPFDDAMDGTVRGEGGVAVLITSRRQAREKGHLVLGALSEMTSGQGTVRTADFGFSGTALTRCLRQADTSNLAHIECHGSGILVADVMEAEAIAACTTIRTMSSTHPHFGHGHAALAGVQFVKALLVRAFNRVPATGNFTQPHPLVHAAVPNTVASRETTLASGFDVGLHAIGMGGACYYIGLRDEGVESDALSRLLQREPEIGPVPDPCRWRPPKPLLLEALARSLTKITVSAPAPTGDVQFVGALPNYGLDSVAFSGDVSVESLVTVGLYLRCTSHIIFVIEDEDWLTRGTTLLKILQVAVIPPNVDSRFDRLCSLDADRDFEKLADLNITLLSGRVDQLPYSVRQFENRPLAGVHDHRDLVLCNIVASLLGVTCNPICDYTDAGLFDVCSEFALLVYSGLFLGAIPTGADVAVRAWGTHGPGPVKRLSRSTVAGLASRLGLCFVKLLPPTEYLEVFAQKDQSLRFIPALVAMKRLVSGAFTSDLTGASELTDDEVFWLELLVRKVLVIVHKTEILRRLELPEIVDFVCLAMPSTPAWQMDILAEYNTLDCSHLSTAGRFALSTIFSFGTRTVATMENAEIPTSSKQLLLVAGTDRQALNVLLRMLEADSRLLLPSIAELLCLSPSPLTRWAIQGVWQVMSEPMKALLPTSCLLGWETTLLLECVGLCPSIGMKFGLFPQVTFEDSLPAQAFLRRWISHVAATSSAEIVVIASPYLHTAMDWECFAGVIDLVGESNPSLNDTIQTSFRRVTIKPERTPRRPPSQRFIRDVLPLRRSLEVAGSELLRNPILFYASTIAYFGLEQDFQSMLDVCRVYLRSTQDLAELSKRADMTSVLESLTAIPEAQRNLLSALAHHITFDLGLSRLECIQAIKTLLPQTGQPLLDAELLYERGLALLDGVAERPAVVESDAMSVVITGATGFLGTFLLHHMLSVGLHTFFGFEDVTIFCITRGLNRLPRSFEKFGLDCPDLRNVEEMPVEGSIDMVNLGLSDANWERLCSSPPGPIIHLAAAVDLVGCYSGLRTINVWPLLEILRLSVSHRCSTRPLVFAGSLGIFPQFVSNFMDINSVQLGPPQEHVHEDQTTVYEHDIPSATLMHKTLSEHLYGYGWTKWVCERVLARLSRERTAPRMLVWRFGHIGYSKSTGYSNTSDPVFGMIDSLRKAMVLPLPADAVCSGRALMESFLSTAGATILTSVDDAARLAARCLRWLRNDSRYDVVHICQNVSDIAPGAVKTSQKGGFLWIGDEINMVPLKIIRLDEITDYMPLPLKGPAAVYQTLYFHSLSGTRDAVHEVSRSNLERLIGQVEWIPFNISRLLKMSSRRIQTSGIGARFATAPLVPGTTNRYFRRLGVEACDVLTCGFQDSELSVDRLKRVNAMLIQYLRNLAFMEKAESDFPEILTQSIDRPVVVLGLNRSGTSFMLNLLNSLNGLSAPLLGELTTPYGLKGELSTDPFSERERLEAQTAGGARFLGFQNVGEALAQEWDTIHAQRPDLPEEDFLIFEHVLRSFSIYCATGSECYLEWLFADDRRRLREAYDFHRAFISHLQHLRSRGGSPTPRWLLKQPFHLFCVDTLLQMYPDCQIVALTRDFDQVLRSWGALLRNVRQRFHGCPVNLPRETELLQEMAAGLETLRDRPNVRFVEYSSLVKDPMSVLTDVCTFLDVSLDRAAAEDFLRRDADRRGHRA